MSNYNLEDKRLDVNKLVQDALCDENLFKELLCGVKSKNNTIRSNCFQTLLIISEEEPGSLYPQWDYFYELLLNANNYFKYIAIYILANLTAVDKENRFYSIFDDYFNILAGDKVMNASHVALNTPIIIKNKPELESDIVEKLLNIDTIHKGKQKELVKAYAIEALEQIYPYATDKEEIIKFIEAQLKSPSPKTREIAACFLGRC